MQRATGWDSIGGLLYKWKFDDYLVSWQLSVLSYRVFHHLKYSAEKSLKIYFKMPEYLMAIFITKKIMIKFSFCHNLHHFCFHNFQTFLSTIYKHLKQLRNNILLLNALMENPPYILFRFILTLFTFCHHKIVAMFCVSFFFHFLWARKFTNAFNSFVVL